MREIAAQDVEQAVRDLCVRACCRLPEDVRAGIYAAREGEPWPVARDVLGTITRNIEVVEADDVPVPLCQDTGMACVFVELGQEVHVRGDLGTAIDRGVRAGYAEGYLRKSMVRDPLRRENTRDNTPALVTYDVVPGDALRITVAPKGAGSENMSRVRMLAPAAGIDGVRDFVVEAVREAGPNPCPPVVVGVGIGANFDHVASLAKRALLRDLDAPNPDPFYAELERELLERVNALGIGPQGFGGRTTALAVHVEARPTHIACLPVAVNINCHVARHAEVVL